MLQVRKKEIASSSYLVSPLSFKLVLRISLSFVFNLHVQLIVFHKMLSLGSLCIPEIFPACFCPNFLQQEMLHYNLACHF